jgi:putative nucleotidyltransferase with HDIG domain
MTVNRPLPRAGALYVAGVVAAGAVIVMFSAYDLWTSNIGALWWLLAALTLLSGSATVRLPSVPATISISETFVFTAVLLYGPAAGAVIVALDGLIISFWFNRGRRDFRRFAFNMAAPALSIWTAASFYFSLPGIEPIVGADAPIAIEQLIPALGLFTLAHFLINSWLIALAVSFETGRAPFDIWQHDFLWLSLNYFGGASVSILIVRYAQDFGPDNVAVPVYLTYLAVLVPLLLILYFTFKVPMARVEDANRHLAKLNGLYLSTIETLAMAVDAKDQVTHGHIRRVQTYAVGLARAVGVTDPGLLGAIEASALLHDMGKLAVPEHILNKPGKLTSAEFSKMKLHASVGADILSAIEFPYPVIPIVRHHHENWDGSGYPSGLKGVQIPIGARVLAVVDCYDALTSDRPYRPKLVHEQAAAILLERRGTMYDPLVVDTFLRLHHTFGEIEAEDGHIQQREALADIARLNAPTVEHQKLVETDSCDLGAAFDDLLACVTVADVAERATSILTLLVRVVNARAGLIALYGERTDSLTIISTTGVNGSCKPGVQLALGQGLTGWVAANKQRVVNSDATLDVEATGAQFASDVRALSVPLVSKHNALVGVISLYSPTTFSSQAVETLTVLSSPVASLLGSRRSERLHSVPLRPMSVASHRSRSRAV